MVDIGSEDERISEIWSIFKLKVIETNCFQTKLI